MILLQETMTVLWMLPVDTLILLVTRDDDYCLDAVLKDADSACDIILRDDNFCLEAVLSDDDRTAGIGTVA